MLVCLVAAYSCALNYINVCVRPVGNLENIHPVGLMENDFDNEREEDNEITDEEEEMTAKLKQLRC